MALILATLAPAACKKIKVITDPTATVNFSTDTLSFDTVFTTVGSSTKNFKVFNPYAQSIIISSIELAGGSASQFRINVDGLPGTAFTDLEIAPKDSMYIFVEVTVDPQSPSSPFVIYDSVLFLTNGNHQKVLLQAYGQNAHFLADSVLPCSDVWIDDLPYVILEPILVDSGCTLTITEGVNVFLHADAYIFVQGALQIAGAKDSIVSFEGDRLEHFFDDLPGQWGGIVFLRGSTGNTITHARFSEATSAIIAGSSTSTALDDFTNANKPDVFLRQTVIRNCSQWGVFSFLSDIKAENCLIYGCGDNDVGLLFGGTHEFTHCTLANYGVLGIDHISPVLRLTNYALQSPGDVRVRDFSGAFTNCIVYGNKSVDPDEPADGELEIDFYDDASGMDTSYVFDHCFIRTNWQKGSPFFVSVSRNTDPQFEDLENEDYTPGEGSAVIDAGKALPGFVEDVFGNPRPSPSALDVGAVERQ
jgi:hypothetical protein